jgi:hypothetical protein
VGALIHCVMGALEGLEAMRASYQGPGPMCGAMGALETGGARRCEWKKVEDGGRLWWELWAASCWEP